MAWQFDRPETGEGAIQVFRRAESPYEALRLKLRGLDPQARYRVRDLDKAGAKVLSGAELMDPGLRMDITAEPGSAVLVYERVE